MSGIIITESDFGKTLNGREITLITLTNAKGAVVQLTNYGARVVTFLVKNKKHELQDIIIGHKDIEGYLNSKERYFNAVIGRYAGRIDGGRFSLNSSSYTLDINSGENHLHGGKYGFNEAVWEIVSHTEKKVKFKHISKDGEGGYPGTLELTVKYTLTDNNELVVDYEAKSDKDTVINLTNHMFFNLNDDHSRDILNHKLLIAAENYLPLNSSIIPTGEENSVRKTAFDFISFKSIGQEIASGEEQLKLAKGYDHTFVLAARSSGAPVFAAAAICSESGLILEVSTTEPSVHLYTGNYLAGLDIGKYGVAYKERGAFCLETQHFPDSPNHPSFPTTELKAGKVFSSSTIYKVAVIK